MAKKKAELEGRAALAEEQRIMLDELGPPPSITFAQAALWWAKQWTTDELEQQSHVAACVAICGAPPPSR